MKEFYTSVAIILLHVLLFIPSATAQHSGWRYYGGDHYVNEMADAGDFLWLATKGGLLKMAKASGEIERFTKGNSELRTNTILSVEVDGQNRLWIGTMGDGMLLYDGETWSHPLTSVDDPHIYDICRDSTGNMWAAGSKGAWQFKGGMWTLHSNNNPPFPPQAAVMKISTAADGVVWAATSANGFRFDGEKWNTMITAEAGGFTELNANVNGQIWFGTAGKNAYFYDGTEWSIVTVGPALPVGQVGFLPVRGIVSDNEEGVWAAGPNGLTHLFPEGDREDTLFRNPGPGGEYLTALLTDASGVVWIATGNGIASIADHTVRTYSTAQSEVFDISVYNIEPDPKGGVWIETAFAGITQFDGEHWMRAEHSLNSGFKGQIAFNQSSALSVDSAGNLWVATYKALYRRDNNGWTFYTDTNSVLPGDEYSVVATDQDGSIWAMTSAVPARFKNNEWKVYSPDAGGVVIPFPAGLCVAPDNSIWIGGVTGVRRFNGTDWETFESAANIFDQNQVYAIAADYSSSVVWAGTRNGLIRFDGETWVDFDPSYPDYPQGEAISSLSVDSEGALWIGWFNSGLGRLTDKDFTLYTTANSGLSDDNVRDVAIDKEGNVWVGTLSGGISVLEHGVVSGVEGEREESGANNTGRDLQLSLLLRGSDAAAQFHLPEAQQITVEIIDMLGRTVARPISEEWFGSGSYTLPVNVDVNGGMFFVRLQGEKESVVRRLITVR